MTDQSPPAIDYDALVAKLNLYAGFTDPFHSTTMHRAVAAVEALRERVVELEADLAQRPTITVQEVTREPFTITEDS